MFGRKKPYKRSELLAEAGKARAKKKFKKAAKCYLKILEQEPENAEVEAKLASALAEAGDTAASWQRYQAAAKRLHGQGFGRKARAVLQEATRYLPAEAELWLWLANAQLQEGHQAEAVSQLVSALPHFKKKKQRDDAIRLCARVLEIDNRRADVAATLSGHLRLCGRKPEAAQLASRYLAIARGKTRRALRWTLFRSQPSPASLWRWVVAA